MYVCMYFTRLSDIVCFTRYSSKRGVLSLIQSNLQVKVTVDGLALDNLGINRNSEFPVLAMNDVLEHLALNNSD